MRQIDVVKTVLPNGLRVITATRDSYIFSMSVGIKAGSLYEDKENNGISHMTEHMLFKGTANRTMDELNNDMESLANDLDIYTSYKDTVLTVNIMKNHGAKCIEIVSDMLMNATFPQKELRPEKKVIIEEIKMDKDDAEDLSYTSLYKAAFPDLLHKYRIAGTISSVKSINSEMLREFYKSYYTPSNTVICIVSPYTHEEITAMVEESFGSWKGEGEKTPDFKRPHIIPKKVIRHKKGISQAHVLYGFDTCSLSREEETALGLLNRKIGSGANSVLFKELRDKKGYAYSVYSDVDYTQNVKMFNIYAGISSENLNGTLSTIDEVISKFRNGEIKIDERSIKLIKDIYLTDTAIALESPSHIVDFLLNGELNYNNPLEYQNVLSIIEKTQCSDINDVIDKVLKDPIIHVLLPS